MFYLQIFCMGLVFYFTFYFSVFKQILKVRHCPVKLPHSPYESKHRNENVSNHGINKSEASKSDFFVQKIHQREINHKQRSYSKNQNLPRIKPSVISPVPNAGFFGFVYSLQKFAFYRDFFAEIFYRFHVRENIAYESLVPVFKIVNVQSRFLLQMLHCKTVKNECAGSSDQNKRENPVKKGQRCADDNDLENKRRKIKEQSVRHRFY